MSETIDREDTDEPATKRAKHGDDECLGATLAAEFQCPITLEVLYRPVLAEDGRLYEKHAIAEWIKQNRAFQDGKDVVKSPATNVPMGTKVTEVLQVQNAIAACMDAKLITGAAATVWLKKKQDAQVKHQQVLALMQKAGEGDADAAHELAIAYENPNLDLDRDDAESSKWHKIAADLGHPTSASVVGLCTITGQYEFPKNDAVGMSYILAAALLGSETGCFGVGDAYLRGKWGYPKNHEEAVKWFRKMPSCTFQDALHHDRRERAKKFIERLTNPPSSP